MGKNNFFICIWHDAAATAAAAAAAASLKLKYQKEKNLFQYILNLLFFPFDINIFFSLFAIGIMICNGKGNFFSSSLLLLNKLKVYVLANEQC